MFLKPHCALCDGMATDLVYEDGWRQYWRCKTCCAVFVPAGFHLSREEEKRRYDTHRNHPDDPKYRGFLQRLYAPMIQRLTAGAIGLDYGSGPGPTLAIMFQESGYEMDIYDPYYANNPSVFGRRYDFISCSETAEHFCRPGLEWARLTGLLKPGGLLGVMTGMLDGAGEFSGWYYKNDPTHVLFYSAQTFRWLASRYRLDVEFFGDSVVLLRRS